MQVFSYLIFYRHLSRRLTDMWDGFGTAHTPQAEILFFSVEGEGKKTTSPPWTAPALDQSMLLHLQAMKGGLCVKTLSCSSEFPHLSYVAFDDAFKSGEEKTFFFFDPLIQD